MANNILRGLIEDTGITNGAQKRPREAEEDTPAKKYVQISLSNACKWHNKPTKYINNQL